MCAPVAGSSLEDGLVWELSRLCTFCQQNSSIKSWCLQIPGLKKRSENVLDQHSILMHLQFAYEKEVRL
jgi:hypothetical protein